MERKGNCYKGIKYTINLFGVHIIYMNKRDFSVVFKVTVHCIDVLFKYEMFCGIACPLNALAQLANAN